MEFKRSERVQELLLEEISKLIQHELKDPRIGFVTVTRVNLAGNLQHAKIYVSIMGTDQEKKDSLEGLQSARGFIRQYLGKNLSMKYIPGLDFRIDKGAEHVEKISKIINGLHT
jgi:ribosome-binding factor A